MDIFDKYLKRIFVTGLLSIVFSLVFAACFKDWFGNALLNIGSGLITSAAVIFFYNRKQDSHRELDRKRRQKIALEELNISLRSHVAFLQEIYVCAASIKPNTVYDTVTSFLLDEQLLEQIINLDVRKPSPQGSSMTIPWCNYMSLECRRFEQDLKEVRLAYGNDLNTDTIELLRNLRQSAFVRICEAMPEVYQIKELPFSPHTLLTREIVEEYVYMISDLLSEVNRIVDERNKIRYDDNIWNNQFYPVGCGRIDNMMFQRLI